MTTNTDPTEFEPTLEMRERWLSISDKTTVEMTNALRIDVPCIDNRPSLETWTDQDASVLMPYFGLERLELILVGDYICCYWQDQDILFVHQASAKDELNDAGI